MPGEAYAYETMPYTDEAYGFVPVVVGEALGKEPSDFRVGSQEWRAPVAGNVPPFADSVLQAIVAAEHPEDELIRKRADRLVQKAAALAVSASVETRDGEERSRYGSLLEAIHGAACGETEAVSFIRANVRSDVIERSIKEGHITEVEVETDDDGRILQFGQYLDDIHVNTLVYGSDDTEMVGRFTVDVRNGKRAEHHNQQGRLEDNYFLEMSLVADMPTDKLKEAGFFTDTMSLVVRLWGAQDGALKMESAFVAGVKEPGGQRHDRTYVQAIGEALGVDYSGMTATEILDGAVLIPKSMLPGGIIDLLRIGDEATGTFFGQDKPKGDYQKYLRQCRQREEELEPTVQQIVSDLIAAAPYLRTPEQATGKLHDLSEKHLVRRALTDRKIDLRVFGAPSAAHIIEARQQMAIGDLHGVEESLGKAEKTADTSSCPTGKTTSDAVATEGSAKDDKASNKSEKSGIKKMTCPFCKDPNQYGDPCSPNQHCTNCNARVTNGKVTSEGDGGRKARQARAAKRMRELAGRQRKAGAERSKARREAGERQPKLTVVR